VTAVTRDRVLRGTVLSLPLLWTLVFLIVPYLIIFTYSFYARKYPTFLPDFQFGNYLEVFRDPQYYQVLWRTAKIACLVAILATLLSYPLAYVLVFKVRSARLRAALYLLVIVPLWVSYLLRTYIWKTILGSEGILNSFLISLGVLDEPSPLFLYNQFAMVLTLTYIFVPFMVMPIYTALEKIPRNLLEASGDLGVGPLRSFFAVTLPLSLPGVIAGVTFTFCLTFGDFVAPLLVGGPDGQMIATVIASQFGATLNWPLGSALSIVMLLVVLAVLSLSQRLDRSGKVELA